MAWTREEMAQEAASELKDGFYVNLGIGIPTMVANYIPEGMDVTFESENGILGVYPFPLEADVDSDLVNASKQTVTLMPGGVFFDSATSFDMIRGGHVDMAILGAMQLSEKGDIANWMIPGKLVKGMGGAMDLVAGAKRVIVIMEHCSKKGDPKLLRECNLPLTAAQAVNRVITDLAVFEIDPKRGMVLEKMAPGVTIEELRAKTEAHFTVGIKGADWPR